MKKSGLNKKRLGVGLAGAFGAMALTAGAADAKVVNFTDVEVTLPAPDGVIPVDADGVDTINGGRFEFFNEAVSGSGTYVGFVRVHESGTGEEGYNTDGAFVYDEVGGGFTHDITMASLGVVDRDGTDYVEFGLDINESGGGGNEFLSLDTVEIYVGSEGAISLDDPGDRSELGTLVYNMDADADGDSTVLLDYSKSAGSGKPDMLLLVPATAFSGFESTDFVYLYSHFGAIGPDIPLSDGTDGHFDAFDGFEEWAQNTGLDTPFDIPPVPLPAAAWMGLPVLAGMGMLKRKKANG